MKKPVVIALLTITCLSFKANSKISTKDFDAVLGKWKGTLTYLDYTTGKPYKMPANVTVTENENNSHQLIFIYEYPNEPKANGNDTLTIDDKKMLLNKGKLISKRTIGNSTEIIATENGKDGNDNKNAIIKNTYLINKAHFSMQKDVQFDGETKWILRDTYTFER